MSNFQTEFEKGQAGKNAGLHLGDGLGHISSAIGGLQKGMLIGVAGAAKAGKSTLVNYMIKSVKDYATTKNIPIEIIYYSLEMSRVSLEADFISHYLFIEYGIENIKLPPGILYKGNNFVSLSARFILGKLRDDEDNLIKVSEDLSVKINLCYHNNIIPFFGKYDKEGNRIEKGVMTVIEESNNPTGIYNQALVYGKNNGTIHREKEIEGRHPRIIGYTPDDPSKFTIIVLDHKLMWL